MASILTELNEFTSDIVVPDDSDPRSAASVRVAFQRLANRSLNAKNRLDATESCVPGRAASISVPIALNPATAPGQYTLDLDTTFGWRWLATATGGQFVVALPLPPKGRLTEFHVFVEGIGAHAALPAQRPLFHVYQTGWTPGGAASAYSVIGTATDPSATLAAYETVHAISLTGLSVDLSWTPAEPGRALYLRIIGESGANSLAAGLALIGATAVIGLDA